MYRHAYLLAFGLLVSSGAQATVVDQLECRFEGTKIVATYDGQKVEAVISNGGQTQSIEGVAYQLFTAQQVKSDEVLSGLAQYAHIPADKIATAANFLIVHETGGDFMLIKYNDAHGALLGAGGVNGMSPFVCEK